jgi:esterase/lipase
MDKKSIKSISLKSRSNLEFFLIHGYTGGPTDFNKLPYFLNKKLKANVKVIMLPGHGTKIQDLDNIVYSDLINAAEKELKRDIQAGKKVILGGISLGGLMALDLASKYPVLGVFNVCSPFKLKFPFSFPGIGILGFKKYWKKHTDKEEKSLRTNCQRYEYMHANALKIVEEANQRLMKRVSHLSCPVLTIHSISDTLSKADAAKEMHQRFTSGSKRIVIFNRNIHNLFFSYDHNQLYNVILNFSKQKIPNKKIAAIVPAYNEETRIGDVLSVLSKTKILDEIIVIDDGSSDKTSEVVRRFPNVKYIKNKINLGKAASMDKGVKSTKADIIFFCDADLIGITPEIVEEIIRPVILGKYCMFIGLRSNFMQKSVRLFALNSGERALSRDLWERLPKYFKHRYRIEAGLNYFSKSNGGFGYKTFPYSQPTKEKKYGYFKGMLLRWGMNFDVGLAYSRAIYDSLISRNSKSEILS